MEKSAARRTALVDEKRCLVTRAPYKRTITSDNVSSTTHLSSEANLTMELDQGMSYVRGEYVRSTISEDQSGVYAYVDLELIDVSTCETAPDLYIDFWHCNSRCVFRSSRVRQWQSKRSFQRGQNHPPWHPANQRRGTRVLRDYLPGPLFWTCDPFRHGHPQPRNCFGSTILEYPYLGDYISDGLLLWGVIGVDMSTTYEITPAAALTEHGGVIHDPSSIGGSNMTGDFPSGTGSDNSTSSGSDTTGSLPSGDESGESTSSSDNSTISLLHEDLLCKCTTYTA
ncbi:uncharacterized protein ARMOST_01178 [Armillaria ostoyae]|uniref:Intradiol ring-cleavage dioxygenases domain-containing protein n=1 Tax=Armillaria ostoyae TaxID=47428 RepID=A0A284QN68_ARMOS|nr:uncharacterized protein ARMOST_01178 [Armillaria ostoyae]